jgi:uncharacterized membrane protein
VSNEPAQAQPATPPPASAHPTVAVTDPVVVPSRDDPWVAALSNVIGGPLGRLAITGRSWWTPIRVLLLMVVVTSALGVLADQPCRANDWTTKAQYTAACYSDVPHLFRLRGLAQGYRPYLDNPSDHGNTYEQVEYPVLTGGLMYAESLVVPKSWQLNDRARFFYDVNAVVMAVLAVFLVWATALTAGPRPWDAAMVALAPGLLLTATLNWDLLAVSLTAASMLLWARRHPAWAGMFLGLGAAAKFYPLLLLIPLFVLCLRAGRLRAFGTTLLTAALAWLAVNLPVLLANPTGWAHFYVKSRNRGADFGSFWLVLSNLHGRLSTLTTPQINTLGATLFALGCLALAALGLMARRRPRYAQLAFLVVVLFLMVSKVDSPQYVLWLIPLAALARPRWRDFLLWSGAQVVYFVAVWWYIIEISTPGKGLPVGGYNLAILLELGSTAAYAALVVRDVLQPENDPVRSSTGRDDPGGGVLDEAPDLLTASHQVGQKSRNDPDHAANPVTGDIPSEV